MRLDKSVKNCVSKIDLNIVIMEAHLPNERPCLNIISSLLMPTH